MTDDKAARLPASGKKALPAGQTATMRVDTPLGVMLLAACGEALAGAWFLGQDDVPAELAARDAQEGEGVATEGDGAPVQATPAQQAVLRNAANQLGEWFSGQRKTFDLPLVTAGTPFQQEVWRALLDLSFGQTCSYGDLAHRIGRPRAVRAVAQAVGRNPISIVIPCHRVVGHDSSLTGFGGGLVRKRALLAHEGHIYAGPSARARERSTGQLPLDW